MQWDKKYRKAMPSQPKANLTMHIWTPKFQTPSTAHFPQFELASANKAYFWVKSKKEARVCGLYGEFST
jgi:hypothetical protein